MSESRPWTFDYLLLMLLALFGCLLVGTLIEAWLIGPSLREVPSGKFVATVIHVGCFNVGGIACVGLLLTLEKKTWSDGFGLKRQPFKALAIGAGVAALITPVMMILQSGIAKLITPVGEAPQVQQVVRTIENTTTADQLLFYGFLAIILAPIIEELLFRGVFYPAIRSAGYPRLALWGTAITFGLIHATPLAVIPLTLLAIVLAKLYDRTGNILAPIAAHAMFNCINFVIVLNLENFKRWAAS